MDQFPDFNYEELKKQKEEADKERGTYQAIGSVLKGFDQVQSPYEMLYGGKHVGDSASLLDSAAAGVKDPIAEQQKMAGAYKSGMETKDLSQAEKIKDMNRTAGSPITLMKLDLAKKSGLDVSKLGPEVTGEQVDQLIDAQKLNTERARAQSDFANQLALKKFEKGATAEEKAKDRASDIEKLQMKAELEKANDTKNLPQNVYQAATYGKRVEDANKQMEDLMAKGYDPTSAMASLENSAIYPERMRSNENKLMDQAQRNFVNSVLRRESGSAISASEFASARAQYFPQAGDTAEVLAQKQRNRQVALAGLKAEGAKAWPKLEGNLPPELAEAMSTKNNSSDENMIKAIENKASASGMVKIQTPNGKIVLVPSSKVKEAVANGGKVAQ